MEPRRKNTAARLRNKYNLADGIMNYEAGMMSDEQIVELFQHLIDNGAVWRLQGHYGRTAEHLISAGLCHR